MAMEEEHLEDKTTPLLEDITKAYDTEIVGVQQSE